MSRVRIASEVDEEVWVELMRHARDLGRPLPEVLTEALGDYLTQHRFRPDVLGSLSATADAGHTMEELLREAPAKEHAPEAPTALPQPSAPSPPAPPPPRQPPALSHPAIAPPIESPPGEPLPGEPAKEPAAPEAEEEAVPSGTPSERRRFGPLRIT